VRQRSGISSSPVSPTTMPWSSGPRRREGANTQAPHRNRHRARWPAALPLRRCGDGSQTTRPGSSARKTWSGGCSGALRSRAQARRVQQDARGQHGPAAAEYAAHGGCFPSSSAASASSGTVTVPAFPRRRITTSSWRRSASSWRGRQRGEMGVEPAGSTRTGCSRGGEQVPDRAFDPDGRRERRVAR